MAGGIWTLDGLWRCLCPSVDVTAVNGALQAWTRPIRRPALACANIQVSRQIRAQSTHALSPSPLHPSDRVEQRKQKPHGSPKSARGNRERTGTSSPGQVRYEYMRRLWKRNPDLPSSLFTRRASGELLGAADSHQLGDVLRALRGAEGQYHKVARIVHYLVAEMHMAPNAFLYECLILANVDPGYGSAQVVAQLLDEMERTGIIFSSAIYHAVMDVLAIHPDYALRNKMLAKMKESWLPLTLDGEISVALGLLRDGQPELALAKLEGFSKQRIYIPQWLLDVFLYNFAELGITEEVSTILRYKIMFQNTPPPDIFWHSLLNRITSNAYYEEMRQIWITRVMSNKTNLSDGAMVNVINVATRHGDVEIARDAIRKLSDRGKNLEMHHLEPLLEGLANGGDLRKALLTLCIMHKAGLQPDSSTTRPLYRLLMSDSENEDAALSMLHALRKDHHVPIAAFNVLLESKLMKLGSDTVPNTGTRASRRQNRLLAATLRQEKFDLAVDLYRNVRHICVAGPDLTTYKLLLSQCTSHKSMRFLLGEMEYLRIRPDQELWDRAIRICTMGPNYWIAFQYLDAGLFEESRFRPKDWTLSRETAVALIKRCMLAEDVRARELVDQCREQGMDIEGATRELMQDMRLRRLSRKMPGQVLPVVDVPEPLAEEAASVVPVPARDDSEPALASASSG